MTTVVPSFYEAFVCKAERCRHSCCRGWEIDVDEDSAALYRSLPGPLGEDLRAALREDEEGFHFRLTAEGRCPFLEQSGLCRLIRELGEDALCDICALHPRFFETVGDYELAGLGLSCEAVCALLLAEPGPLRFICGERRDLRLKDLTLLFGWQAPPQALHFVPRPEAERAAAILDRLSRTEPIDEAWPRELAALRAALPEVLAQAQARKADDPQALDRIFQYILYRQLDRAEDFGLPALVEYARDSADFVFLSAVHSGEPAEALRRWSEQIEYSTENVDILLRR